MSSTTEPLLQGVPVGFVDDPRCNHVTSPRQQPCTLAMGDEGTGGFSFTRNPVVRKLSIGIVLATIFMCVEVVGGIMANSLAVLTDAAHLLADTSGFAMSIIAIYYSTRKCTSGEYSYGFSRVEVLAGLASVLTIWLVTGGLVIESIDRIQNPKEVDGKLMFILSSVGILVNLVLMMVLGGHGHGHDHDHHEHDHEHGHNIGSGHTHSESHDINLKGATLHVIGDLLQSIGVAIGSALIWYHQDDPSWLVVDPLCTILFAILVIWSTSSLIRDISDILMERSPRGIKIDKLKRELMEIDGVHYLHDFHLWSLTPRVPLLVAHLHVCRDTDGLKVLEEAQRISQSHNIEHSTFQIDIDEQP